MALRLITPTIEYLGQLLKKKRLFLFNFYFFKTENTGKYLRFILKAELKRDLNDSCPLRWLSAQD